MIVASPNVSFKFSSVYLCFFWGGYRRKMLMKWRFIPGANFDDEVNTWWLLGGNFIISHYLSEMNYIMFRRFFWWCKMKHFRLFYESFGWESGWRFTARSAIRGFAEVTRGKEVFTLGKSWLAKWEHLTLECQYRSCWDTRWGVSAAACSGPWESKK